MNSSGVRKGAKLSETARYRLGSCEFVPSLGTVQQAGEPAVRLEPKATAVLECLAERPGTLVTREELLEHVWGGRYVTDHVLSRSVSLLRKALGDDVRAPRFIETVPTRGYRLLVTPSMVNCDDEPATAAGSRHPRSSLGTTWRLWRFPAASLLLALSIAGLSMLWAPPPAAPAPRIIPLRVGVGSEVDPAIAPDGEWLAFAWSEPDGVTDIFLSNMDGQGLKRLTSGPGRDTNPAWRPDTDELAFSRSVDGQSGLHLLSLSDGSERLLTRTSAHDIADLAWSPDGRHLWFADRRRPAVSSTIARLDVRTGERQWMTAPPPGLFGDRDLALAPDGRRLAFARAVLPGVEDLYVTTLGEDSVRRLTRDGASINGLAWIEATDDILFSSSRDGTSRLWLVPASGGEVRPLGAGGEGAFDPSFAPATGRLVFERRTFDTDITTLSLRPAARLQRASVSPSTRWDASPTIAPDGRSIAFVSARGGASEVWIGHPDSPRTARRLRVDSPVLGRPAWSPDHRHLAVAVFRAGRADLVVIDAMSGREELTVPSAANEICPAFLPDGARILYSSDRSGQWDVWSLSIADGRSRRLLTGASCPQVSSDGRSVFFVRPGRTGIWHVPIEGGPSELVPSTERVLPWDDWALGPQLIVTRPIAAGTGSEALLLDLAPTATHRTTRLPIAAAPFAGLGLSISRDGTYVAFGEASREDSDLMLVEPFP